MLNFEPLIDQDTLAPSSHGSPLSIFLRAASYRFWAKLEV
jgi:hypothetical protein